MSNNITYRVESCTDRHTVPALHNALITGEVARIAGQYIRRNNGIEEVLGDVGEEEDVERYLCSDLL